MEKNIVVVEFEDKIAKNNNPYTRFKTQEGKWLSCFDVATNLILKGKIQRPLIVEVSVNEKGETLRKFIRDIDEAEVIDMTKAVKLTKEQVTTEARAKTTAIAENREQRQWAEMAKEIYLALMLHDTGNLPVNLDTAILVTKRLREEFK